MEGRRDRMTGSRVSNGSIYAATRLGSAHDMDNGRSGGPCIDAKLFTKPNVLL